jgi:hypothetical protein
VRSELLRRRKPSSDFEERILKGKKIFLSSTSSVVPETSEIYSIWNGF